ncbi:MAG: hypothetical protein LBL04_03220 [Bacteroidales bacterium]|jgi:hypothetical protein|nr:hypothetical protein [Bacteroidales bacterium]
MKLLIKILFLIFTIFIVTVKEVKSSTVVNVLQKDVSYSVHLDEFGLTNMNGRMYAPR